jgi:hypothetical protein
MMAITKGECMKRLPTGAMNVLYIKCKPGYAEGVRKPRRVKPAMPVPVFLNTPTIVLRKAS